MAPIRIVLFRLTASIGKGYLQLGFPRKLAVKIGADRRIYILFLVVLSEPSSIGIVAKDAEMLCF